jgi:ketosteroid isomerase-like protein
MTENPMDTGPGNLEVARRGYQGWAAGDIAAMLEVSTSDVEFVPAIAGGVEGGSTKGHVEFRRFFDALGETWETFRLQVDEFREVGDRVIGIGRLTAKGRGSELELDQPMYSVLWFRDGKVARMQSFLDRETAEAAASGEEVSR